MPRSARCLPCLLALLFSISGGAVWAQEAPVAPGARVRVQTGLSNMGRPQGPRTTGRLAAWTADSLILDPRGAQERWAVPIGAVSRLEVSRGPRSRRENALRLGGIGWLVGPVTGAVLSYDKHDDFLLPPILSAVVEGTPLGAAGALAGAIIGSQRSPERWERVPLPPR